MFLSLMGDLPSGKPCGAENFRLAEYRRVLHIFTDLVLEGNIPNENAWLHRKAASASGSGESNQMTCVEKSEGWQGRNIGVL